MNALQARLVTILRNMDAPVTAADIRAKCQLPQDLEVIASNLRALCRIGKAIEVSPARFAHRDYQQRPADAESPQPLTPVSPAAEPAPPARRISKTERVLQVLQQHATSMSAAMTAEQISNALGGEIHHNNVSGMLCSRRAAGNTPELVSRRAPDGRLWWAWCATPASPAQPETETPQEEPDMSNNNNASLARDLGDDIPEFPRVKGGKPPREMPTEPAAAGDLNKELAVMSALEEMASRLDTRQVRDRELKVAVLDRLAAMSLPSVAALLQRIIDEDLAASEA